MSENSERPTYEELLKENADLRVEIAGLKQKLEAVGAMAITESAETDRQRDSLDSSTPLSVQPRVHKHSSPDEKIELFMQLFAGRGDVYARRYVNRRTGQAGYTPVCGNEWLRGICEKPKVKCGKCPNRNLLPLTKETVYRHLRGKDANGEDVVGVYPMLSDETCRFLVADFDDDNWQADVAAFRAVCSQHEIPVAVERSRSGNGGHIWFFFEEPISCALARRLGSSLLTAAMERRHDLSFASYDRLLPNQDTMPSGGFGNLIALPLQGRARKQGNSEFVDEAFMPYPDQWACLAQIRRIPAVTVEALVDKLGKGGELGVLADTEPDVKPWEKKPASMPLSQADFPPTVNLTRANGLYLPKSGCSQRALGRVKRLAAFKNPAFYKAQAMHLSTWQTPRIICTAWETAEYICLPRGLEHDLLAMLEEAGLLPRYRTKRSRGVRLTWRFAVSCARSRKSLPGPFLPATTACCPPQPLSEKR